MNVSVKDAYQMILLEPEKQNSAIASMPKSQNKEMNVSVKDAYQMILLEPEKQNSAIASMPKSEVAKAVPDDVTFAPIEQMESADLHNFYNCKH